MTKQTDIPAEAQQTRASERNSSAATVVGFAILGCLVAGIIGIFKAITMESGGGVFLCLLGSVAAFGTVAYIYLRRE
jgi:hypothetical protein